MRDNNHIAYYILLAAILIAGIILVITASGDKQTQMLIVIGLGFSYVTLGVFHHLINHDLVAKIVIEYVLIAALGVAAAFFIFKGGFGF
jgi:phosphate/sulfate permease